MKPVTPVIIVTLLCLGLWQVYGKESICYSYTPDDSMCFASTNPIVNYSSTTVFENGKSFADGDYTALYAHYNATGNMTMGCVGALQEFVCTFYFKPCYLELYGGNGYSICNSTTIRIMNECYSLPPSELIFNTYTSYVDNNNPRCAYAYQPQCATRTVVHAGSYVAPYRVDNDFGLNYNYTTDCDPFSYSDFVGSDNICTEMPGFGSSCPEGVGWSTWYKNANTAGVKCKEEKFTLENKRHGEPCFTDYECLNGNCTAGYCYEKDYYCTGLYSCRPGMYCYSGNNTCIPMLNENDACTATDPCIAPFTCVLGNCTKPAALGEPCSVMSPGDSGIMNSPFCGPPINSIYDAFTTCAGSVCTRTILKTVGSSCNYNDNSCDPFTSVCNATVDMFSGYCVPPEQVACKISSATCNSEYQYCDCTGGPGATGVCRMKQDHPLIGCQNEHVQLYECLRTKCNAYNGQGQFYDLSYYPFDGYSCGDTQCANETKNAYCCIVDINDGVPLSGLSSICSTPTPTPTPTQTTTLELTTTAAPTTTTEVPTTTVAPTTTTPAPTTLAPTTSEPTTTPAPTTTVAPSTTTAPTTTVAPTTTLSPTTSLAPTTTTTVPTTTVTPTTTPIPTTTSTIAPTTSTVAPTTASPTTVSPTTQGPIVTSAPIAVTTGGTLTATSSGNVAEIPVPVVNNSVVLYSSANASSIVPLSFANTTELPKNAIVQQAQVTFKVTYIEKTVTVVITLTDEFGDVAGSVRAEISSNGTINVDISALYNQILAENKKDIQIRAIRGAILKVSLSVETTDVPVNLDTASVSSTVVYAIVQTAAPTTTAAPSTNAPSTVPTTTKPSLSTASSLKILTSFLVAGIVMYLN